jgi:hypothetical protein
MNERKSENRPSKQAGFAKSDAINGVNIDDSFGGVLCE